MKKIPTEASDYKDNERFQREFAKLKCSELIASLLKKSGLSYIELDKKLGKKKGYTKQILNDSGRLTIGQLDKIVYQLGYELVLDFNKKR